MSIDARIDYVEFPATNIEASKAFFAALLGWEFVDYGPDYASFTDGRINGGFFKTEQRMVQSGGSALIVFVADDLEAAVEAVLGAGGKIVAEIFSFPGGRRFHFADPSGNEFAIWSEK